MRPENDIKNNAEQKYNELKDKATQTKDQVKQKAENIKEDAADGLRHTMDEVRERFSEAQDNVAGFVQKHPYQALFYSLLAGVVTAKMLIK